MAASPLSTWRLASRPGNASASALQPVAVFGTDDRGPLPAKYKDVQEKLGLLFSVRGRSVCTAFCVASDVVATAGHCLLKIAGERTPRIGDFWFLRNYDAVRDIAHIAGHANGTAALNVMSGSMSLNVRPPIEATRDWALVRLARPACTKGVLPIRVLPIDQIMKEAAAKRVFQISYHRDYTPWKLAYGQPCGVPRASSTRNGAPSRRTSPIPRCSSCTPATPAAPPRARRCCSRRTADRRSSASTSAPTCNPRC